MLNGLEQGIGDEGGVSSVPAGVQATVRIDGDQLAVDTGCNTGTESATVVGDRLTIGSLALRPTETRETEATDARARSPSRVLDLASPRSCGGAHT